MKTIRRMLHFPYWPILIAPVILFSPVLFFGKAIYWGTPYLQFIPWRMEAWNILSHGSLPLWNALVGMGAPLMANYQSALFYPATWFLFGLAAIGGVTLMAWGQTLVVIFHIIWAGIGMALLGRRLKLNPLAQTISGLSFCLSGYLVARAGFLSINAAVAWLPWILLTGSQIAGPNGENLLYQRNKPVLKVLIPLVICLTLQILAGHAQTTYYTILLLAIWIVFWGWRIRHFKGALQGLGYLVLCIVAAIMLSAVQLIPTAEYLLQSQRASAVSYDLAMNYSFFPLRFLTLIAPNLFGSPATGNYLLHADNYWEDAIYIGFIPLFMAIVAILRSIIRQRGSEVQEEDQSQYQSKFLGLFLGGIVLSSFILALGKNLPVFPFLYHFVPTFNLFQGPTRFSILAEFGLALLAGIGINLWRRPNGTFRAWTRRGIAVSIAILVGAGLGLIFLPGVQVASVSAIALAGLWGLSVGLLLLFMPGDGSPGKSVWSASLVLVVCLDLLISGWGLNPGISPSIYSQNLQDAKVESLSNGQRIYLDAKSEDSLKFNSFFQFNDFTAPIDGIKLQTSLLPDSNILAGIPSANNFDPIVPERYSRWMEYLNNQANPLERSNMLQLMDVGLVETIAANSSTDVVFQPESADLTNWSACGVIAVDGQDAWNKTTALLNRQYSSGSPDEIILENSGSQSSVICNSTATAKSIASIQTANRIEVTLDSTGDGWLMLSNTWYPGWKAYVDGEEISIARADYLFMAVKVPEGSHRIEFKYQPASFYWGAGLSLFGLLLLSLAFIFHKR